MAFTANLETPRRGAVERLLLSAFPLAILILAVVLAPLLPLPDPNAQQLAKRLLPPVWVSGDFGHLLGTDQLGRDMLSRILAGGRLTLLLAAIGVGIGGCIGTTLGLLAGLRRGMFDLVVTRLIDAQLSLPVILLAMGIIATQRPSIGVLIFVLAAISWAPYARVIRAETLSLRERPFMHGLIGLGVPQYQIVFRHLFPNVLSIFLVMAVFEVAICVLTESSLSFLGLGVQSPNISWGMMLSQGRGYMKSAWWIVVFPGLAITIFVLAVNILGDALRACFDPHEWTRSE